MKQLNLLSKFRILSLLTLLVLTSFVMTAQTNVYDDIIATSPNHTSLAAAISTAGLESALQDDMASLTVFAPDNDAFDALAAALGTDIDGLLALDNLSDILLYHVLGISAASTDVNNGDIVTPLNDANSIKLTKTSEGNVYANHAMVNAADLSADNGYVHSIDAVILSSETVVDIAIDNGFTSLAAAVITAELLPALTDPLADYTVFAPDNDAFDAIAAALGTDIDGLLALENLSDILLYHVLGASALSTDLTNGDIVTPLNDANTIKLTVSSEGMVYANQAMVTIADLTASNGVVHAIDAVILPNETVADIAIDNGFTSLTAALIVAELLPAVTNPLADLTVFAPDNDAFDAIAAALGTDIDGLLALENLSDILLYHVLGASALSTDLTNGDIVTPLNDANTIKLTVTSEGMVYANQAMVTIADLTASNGVVHAINAVILPNETVVDVAIDNGFTTLTTAVITAELLPALTNPLASYTVFAPSNEAFDDLAAALGTDLDGILALPILEEVLLYHVLAGEVLSTDLVNGPVATLNGQNIEVDLSSGVMINSATVVLADVMADNGVVHVIDEVLIPSTTVGVDEIESLSIDVYPNPSSDFIVIRSNDGDIDQVSLINMEGKTLFVREIETNETRIDLNNYNNGRYILKIEGNGTSTFKNLVKVSGN